MGLGSGHGYTASGKTFSGCSSGLREPPPSSASHLLRQLCSSHNCHRTWSISVATRNVATATLSTLLCSSATLVLLLRGFWVESGKGLTPKQCSGGLGTPTHSIWLTGWVKTQTNQHHVWHCSAAEQWVDLCRRVSVLAGQAPASGHKAGGGDASQGG